MTKSMYYNNSPGNQGDPDNQVESYNYMNGKWKDGTPLNYGGDGYPSTAGGTSTSGIVTNHMYPYITPSVMAPWTEITTGNPAGDRRMLGSVAPVTLTPGDVHEVDIAYVFSRSDSGHLKSVDKLYRDIQTVQAFYNDSIPTTCTAFVLSTPENDFTVNDVLLYPTPATSSIILESQIEGQLDAEIISIDGKTVVSKFEISSNKIDISGLNRGIYLIRVTNSTNQVIIKKLIKN